MSPTAPKTTGPGGTAPCGWRSPIWTPGFSQIGGFDWISVIDHHAWPAGVDPTPLMVNSPTLFAREPMARFLNAAVLACWLFRDEPYSPKDHWTWWDSAMWMALTDMDPGLFPDRGLRLDQRHRSSRLARRRGSDAVDGELTDALCPGADGALLERRRPGVLAVSR